MSSGFEDKSGIIHSVTDWGCWYQSIDDVTIEVPIPLQTKACDIKIKILPSSLSVCVLDKDIFSGNLFANIVCDESTWTIEDDEGSRILRIFLIKSIKSPQSCWSSLLKDTFHANFATLDNMQKKMLQERYQRENPGFDFSNAEVTGNYQTGGPDLSS